MDNFRMTLVLKNENQMNDNCLTGRDIIDRFFGETSPPARNLYITCEAKSGEQVIIYIPNDDSRQASVTINKNE